MTLDIVLLVLATWRVTRLVVDDDIAAPLRGWAIARSEWWEELVTCPFCIGFWLSVAAVASYALAVYGGWLIVWRWLAAPWALSIVVGHLSSRLDG